MTTLSRERSVCEECGAANAGTRKYCWYCNEKLDGPNVYRRYTAEPITMHVPRVPGGHEDSVDLDFPDQTKDWEPQDRSIGEPFFSNQQHPKLRRSPVVKRIGSSSRTIYDHEAMKKMGRISSSSRTPLKQKNTKVL